MSDERLNEILSEYAAEHVAMDSLMGPTPDSCLSNDQSGNMAGMAKDTESSTPRPDQPTDPNAPRPGQPQPGQPQPDQPREDMNEAARREMERQKQGTETTTTTQTKPA